MKRLINIKNLSLLLLSVLIIFFLYKCPFAYIFGIPCPGCGMTRAFFALLRLDFAGAFHYHPLFPIVIIALIFFALDYFKLFTLNPKAKNICIILTSSLFIAVYLLRLFGNSPIVQIDFENSLIGSILDYIDISK